MKTLTIIVATFFVVFGLFTETASAQCSVSKHYMQNSPCYQGRTKIRVVVDQATKNTVSDINTNQLPQIRAEISSVNTKAENAGNTANMARSEVANLAVLTNQRHVEQQSVDSSQNSAIQNLNNTLWWHNWFWIGLIVLLAAVLAFAFGRRNNQSQQYQQPAQANNAQQPLVQPLNQFQYGGTVGIRQESWELEIPAPRVVTQGQNQPVN